VAGSCLAYEDLSIGSTTEWSLQALSTNDDTWSLWDGSLHTTRSVRQQRWLIVGAEVLHPVTTLKRICSKVMTVDMYYYRCLLGWCRIRDATAY
jgi:hypothetical protein